MALSLTTLIQEARCILKDLDVGSETFADDQITLWINECIRELSIHFPRIVEYTVSTTAGDHAYDLEAQHTGVISVEYPTGDIPPVYLKRRSCTHPLFYQEDGFYDFFKPSDSDSLNPPQVILSESPPAGDTITLRLLSEHAALSDGSDTTTLQDRHAHLIALFVRWKAWGAIATYEGMYPGPLSALSGTPELNAQKAEEAYRRALDTALSAEAESAVMPWRVDRFDGLY